MEQEIWKAIEGYENLYEISNKGRLRSMDRSIPQQGRLQLYKGKLLSTYINNSGYVAIKLSKNNKKRSFLVHRLVAVAFLPNPKQLPYINHKDEDKSNNNIENLEWCTAIYNINYGTSKKRRSVKMGKRIAMYSTNGKLVNIFYSIREAERKTKIRKQCITPALDKNKTSGGFIWKTIKDTPLQNIIVVLPKLHKKRIAQYDLNNVLKNTFNSLREAEKRTGIKHEYISRYIRGLSSNCGGFIWKEI